MQYNANQKLRKSQISQLKSPLSGVKPSEKIWKRESIDKHSKQINNQELYLN